MARCFHGQAPLCLVLVSVSLLIMSFGPGASGSQGAEAFNFSMPAPQRRSDPGSINLQNRIARYAGGHTALACMDSAPSLPCVQSWGYWLQDIDIPTLAAAPHDLLVIDYSADGTQAEAFTAGEIQEVRESGKVVLAYLSIGEAEDYRFYWRESWSQGKPGFIGPENPDWEGNYKVKYWKNAWWKRALRPYLDRIIAAGFDGVYLDIIDAYYYWGKRGYGLKKSANRMAKLVARIAKYGDKRLEDAIIVCPQNGLSILDDASGKWRERYLADIDCAGEEDLFYNMESDEDKEYRLILLAEVSEAGKKILNVEYIPPDAHEEYAERVANTPFEIIGYAADPDRELDELMEP